MTGEDNVNVILRLLEMAMTALTRVRVASINLIDTLVDRGLLFPQGSFRAVPVTISPRSLAYGRRATGPSGPSGRSGRSGESADDIFDRAGHPPLASPRVTRWVKVD